MSRCGVGGGVLEGGGVGFIFVAVVGDRCSGGYWVLLY
jgi:hypothetical protein